MNTPVRFDYKVIGDIVKTGSRVLDLGCGAGELLDFLAKVKHAKVQGVELCEEAIYKCVEKGLSVFHSDIDSGLVGYPDKSFDYVILNQSMQEVKKVDYVIKEALRVGVKVIVGFPNFAYFRARFRLLFRGKAPMTPALPYNWYNTPNLHFLSLSDFKDYCKVERIKVLERYYLGRDSVVRFWPNFFALNVVFVIMKKAEK